MFDFRDLWSYNVKPVPFVLFGMLLASLPAIPDLRPLGRGVINATSLFHGPHPFFAKRLVCCADQLNPPRKVVVRTKTANPAAQRSRNLDTDEGSNLRAD